MQSHFREPIRSIQANKNYFIEKMTDKNSKFYFTPEEREVFIDFIRENDVLYKNKRKGAGDFKEKNRLWKQIASQINKSREQLLNRFFFIFFKRNNK